MLIYLNLMGLESTSTVFFQTKLIGGPNMDCKCSVKNNEKGEQYQLLSTKTELPNGQIEYTYKIDMNDLKPGLNFNLSPNVECGCDPKSNQHRKDVTTKDVKSSMKNEKPSYRPGKCSSEQVEISYFFTTQTK